MRAESAATAAGSTRYSPPNSAGSAWSPGLVGLAAVSDDLPVLDAEEQRCSAPSLEKQRTVPASYPLLSGLACGVQPDQQPQLRRRVRRADRRAGGSPAQGEGAAADRLVGHRPTDAEVPPGPRRGARPRWQERALLTVLLLCVGPNTPGELRTRTERPHLFARTRRRRDLPGGDGRRGLVQVLPRLARPHDPRWVHLLGEVAAPDRAVTRAPSVDRESPVADGADARDDRVRATYAAVAETLRRAAVRRARRAAVRAVAAGPGGRARRRRTGRRGRERPGPRDRAPRGPRSRCAGIDLTPEMVEQARQRHPGTVRGRRPARLMRPETAPGWRAVLAWYSRSTWPSPSCPLR